MNTKKKLKGKLLYCVLKPAVKAGIRCVQVYPRDEEQATQPKRLQLPGTHSVYISPSTGGL